MLCREAYDDSKPIDHRLGTSRVEITTCSPIDKIRTINEYSPRFVSDKLTNKGELSAIRGFTSNCSNGDVKIVIMQGII